jgi:hypothetical protein
VVQAAPFNAFIQGSMARIAALPHVYHWDFISSELFVVMPFVILLVAVRFPSESSPPPERYAFRSPIADPPVLLTCARLWCLPSHGAPF